MATREEFEKVRQRFEIENGLENVDPGKWPAEAVEKWRLVRWEFEAEHGLL